MATEKQLEERMGPILNPEGANRQATKELIDTLSTVVSDPIAGRLATRMIEAIKEGYKIQSGESYDQL
jgi:hypothetical protein